MIKSLKKLEVTVNSHPFCSAVNRCALADNGYTEEEYLFEGTSNIYRTGPDGLPQIEYADCAYTDRMIVRRPLDAASASGAVVVEIINSTANFDIERIWAESWRYFLRHGITYVGITSKPNVFPALQRFDPLRYGPLNWPNPAPPDPETAPSAGGVSLGAPDQEMGYIWDILLELPQLLKSSSPANPLLGLTVRNVYLAGWSQSCSYINCLVNRFLYAKRDHTAKRYDGYLAAGGVHALATPLNRREVHLPADSLSRRIDFCPVPLIEINTESENSDETGCCGYSARRADANEPGFLYRYIEIPGSCHDASDSARDYTRFDNDVERALGFPLKGFDAISRPNSYPKYFGFHLAWRNLMAWAEKGIVPCGIPRIAQSAQGHNLRDALGNCIGGLRSPLVDYPCVRYYAWSETSRGRNELMGHETCFSKAWLQETYTDLENYTQLVTQSAHRCAARGMLLQEDVPEMINAAVSIASQCGL